MIAAVIAATFTFTATATGVGKGTPLEFVFAGKDSDRDYETMFLLDEPVDAFCSRLEAAGLPRGKPTSVADCRLRPVGCPLEFSPAIGKFVTTTLPDGISPAPPIYTGGSRADGGAPVAATEMPSAVFSLYTLAQAPIVFDGIYDQGLVYGAHLAAVELKKGSKVTFTITWNEQEMPKHLDVLVVATNATALLSTLRNESEKGAVDVTAGFDRSLTIKEAAAAAAALSLVDSTRIKINGRAPGSLFYRAFLPEADWTNRTARLVQPFELTIAGASEKFVFIDEDWNVDGDDPKLTPREIPISEAKSHSKTDTCFVFAPSDTRLSRVMAALDKMGKCQVKNVYVFGTP